MLAEEDAFVKDAKDGFYANPEDAHEKHLESIRKKIGIPQASMEVQRTKPNYWAMAAALALFISAVWFFNSDIIGSQSKEVAQAMENTTAAPMPSEERVMESESPAADEAATPGTLSLPPKAEQGPTSYTVVTPTPTADVSKIDFPEPAKSKDQVLKEYNAAKANAQAQAQAKEKKEAKAKRRVEPTVTEAEMDEARAAARAKKKELEAPIPAPKVEKVYAGKDYPSSVMNTSVPPTAPVQEVLEEDISFNTDRVEAAFVDSLYDQDDAELPRTSEPSIGWDEYRRYLRANAQLTPEAMNNNVSGVVRLRFMVNQDGAPVNIVVLQSLGFGCDDEAIRLVRQGATWGIGQSNVVTLDVSFTR